MQLSAASLLAAQQSAKPQGQTVASGFAAALSENQKAERFAPIDFRQPAKHGPAVSQAARSAPARLGTAIDIRV